MLEKLRHRFLSRLAAPEDAAERVRTERVLASARMLLTITALIAVYMDPTEPTRYAELAYGILIAYCVWGIYVWVHVHRTEDVRRLAKLIHFLDVAFPMTFILFTAGPNSPFFVFLLFVLTAAAFRWGFPETMLTAFIVVALLLVEASLISYGPRTGWIAGQYEVNRFVIRISYLLTLGVLVGYLGEEEKQWRAENSTISRLLSKVHAENGMRSGMQLVLSETVRIFRARRALVTLKQAGTDQIYVWKLPAPDGPVHGAEVETDARGTYECAIPAGALFGSKRSRGWRSWAVSADGRRVRLPLSYDPGTLPEMNGTHSVWAVTLDVGEEWSGYVLLYDAITGPDVSSELRFMRNLMRQIGPALYTVFLLRRLRSRAGAIERARVARDLHDGAIQALISVEMQVDVLRRQLASPDKASHVASRLTHVQELVRQQVFDLRMLMQQMKPVDFGPGQLLDYMAEMVDRFRRDTGIGAQFVTTLEDVQMPSRVSRELARILQEGLVNVRKHSGATNVQVRFAAEDGCWKLGIVDNGRGFDFAGRLNLKELDAARLGPGIIRERVRSLGGDLTLLSTPDLGSELTITLPQKAQSSYA
jgi:signal transduction histidine kinase